MAAISHHYKNDHELNLEEKEEKFDTEKEFLNWKKNLEETTNTRFNPDKTEILKSSTTCSTFNCHRSGKIIITVPDSKKKRSLKLRGTKKLHGVCPAKMKLVHNASNGKYKVYFCDQHVGNDVNNKKELGFVSLHKEDRVELASKISSGIPLQRIRDQNTDESVLDDCFNAKLNRLKLLTNQDLHSIEDTFNVKSSERKPRPFKNDVDNVEAWLKNQGKNVLFFKEQNSLSDRFPNLEKQDIEIVLMWPAQKKLIKKFSNNVIGMDGSHGINRYNFLLQTLLILDYDGEGYPAAFAISNRNDKILIDVFLTCIKAEVGSLSPKTLITDMQASYYNSWVEMMQKPVYRLYCTWHFFETLRKNQSKIQNKDKRKAVMEEVYSIASETDEKEFREKLNRFLNNSDPDLQEFIKYFRNQYASDEDTIRRWAYCYRMFAGINTNMHLEAFHRILKYMHGRGKVIKTLYDGLEVIYTCLVSQLMSISIKIIRGKVTPKLRNLRQAHKKMENFLKNNDKFSATPIEESVKWEVPSFQNADNFEVQELNNSIEMEIETEEDLEKFLELDDSTFWT